MRIAISVCVFIATFASNGQEQPGELRFGMSTVLSGPAKELGRKFSTGVLAAFDEVNQTGGIRGRTLSLIALDDSYEPVRTVPNMQRLIQNENVLAVIGNVGTPTAVVAIPLANESRTPFLFAYTGAGILRNNPPDRWVVNYRASYAEEIETVIDGLCSRLGFKPEEIAFFTQRDAYGDAGFAGGIAALQRRGLNSENSVAHVRYERNTVAVELALADLMIWPVKPKAVIMVGTYAPCARFIKTARAHNFNPAFVNVSFVGGMDLARELGSDGDGVIVTQVVPPLTEQLPACEDYHRAIARTKPGTPPSFASLEGFIAGRILIQALKKEGAELSREGILKALENLGEFDIGIGEKLNLSPENHQASRRVWPTILRNGTFKALEWEVLKKELNP